MLIFNLLHILIAIRLCAQQKHTETTVEQGARELLPWCLRGVLW